MTQSYTISIDAMGGDHGPNVTVPGCLPALKKNPNLNLLFVGQPDRLKRILTKHIHEPYLSRCDIVPASELVGMDEAPSSALRAKKDSSMRVAINLVKEGRAQACVSAGNTGALMATARFVLKTLPGIDRPAIMARFPTMKSNEVRVLDLGANVDSSPEHLMQFAVMGSIVAEAVEHIDRPSVGLLNIGEEEIKGNELVKETANLLSRCEALNYAGFVEGNAIFHGAVDVVVCDGFVGNSVLKACEGMAKLITGVLKEEASRSLWSKLAMLTSLPVLKRLKDRIDPGKRNGASLLGLNGIVIKSHGSADQFSFSCAVEEAVSEIENNVPARISERLGEILTPIVDNESSGEIEK